MRICSPDCPRQQTLAWRAERKYHSLRRWNRPQVSRVSASLDTAVRSPGSTAGADEWELGACSQRQLPQRHGTSSPSACHLPDYARRRFRSSGWMSHDVDGRSPAPQRVPFWHLASGDPPLGLLSRLTWWKGNTPRPPHLTQAFQAIGNPETSARSIVCRGMGFRREGSRRTVMGS